MTRPFLALAFLFCACALPPAAGREAASGATPSDDGYFVDRGFHDEATARRVAQEIQARQCVGEKQS